MKKFLLFIALLFAVNISAQTTITNVKSNNFGAMWSDSLYQDYPNIHTVDSTHSTRTFKLSFLYDFMNLTVQDTGTTYDDSCIVEYPVYKIRNRAITDTIYQPVQFMRDSSWTNINGGRLLVDDNSVHSYQIFVGDYDHIQVRMLNTQIKAGRVWRFWATLSTK
jgi:hypothetical protein